MSEALDTLDIKKAELIWSAFQENHDISAYAGRTAGIDPISGRVWLGDSILDVSRQMSLENLSIPLYFVRIGQDHYYRKGGRRQ